MAASRLSILKTKRGEAPFKRQTTNDEMEPMKIKEIYDLLNEISPFELQESWDNSGLLVGGFDQSVKQIVLSVDIDEALIETYEEGTLFVLHLSLIHI